MIDPIRYSIFSLVYDGEDEGNDGEAEGNNDNNSEANEREQPPPKEKGKVFSQDDVNRILAEDKRKNQKGRDELLNQLNKWKENLTLTEQQKDELQTRIDQIQAESMTQQELTKKEKDKLIKEWEKKEKTYLIERDEWKNRYTDEKIHREIIDAGLAADAVSAPQLADMLTPKAKLVEVLKDGKPTGTWETRVTLRDKNENGEGIVLELPVTEAVNRMKEMKEYWNLFNSGLKGGLGSFNNGSTTTMKGTKPPRDHKSYMKWKEANLKV